MRIAVSVCVALMACSKPSPAPTVSNKPAADTTEARSYMLGRGVPRDYRIAAKLYGESCASGCGDIALCRPYLEMVMRSRGVLATEEHMKLAARMCDHGEKQACLIAGQAGLRSLDFTQKSNAAKCDSGELAACELDLTLNGAYPRESSEHESRRFKLSTDLCLSGKAAWCVASIHHQWRRCDAETGQPCIDKQPKDSPIREAWKRVQAECAEGDADACEQVPGKAVARMTLCEAGDFGVCDQLENEPRAKEILCAAGRLDKCDPPTKDYVSPARSFSTVVHGSDERCKQGDQEMCATHAKLTTVSSCK